MVKDNVYPEVADAITDGDLSWAKDGNTEAVLETVQKTLSE